jgi:hypothetical protein
VTVTLRFSGPIRRPWPEAERRLEVAPGACLAEVLVGLGFPRHQHPFLQVAVNGTTASLSATLGDGDHVDVMLRVGGG